MDKRYSIVIAKTNKNSKLKELLEAIDRQTVKPEKVFIPELDHADSNALYTIGLKEVKTPFVLLQSDQAVFCGENYCETLLSAFEEENVAVATPRQISGEKNLSVFGAYEYAFFPEETFDKTKQDIYFHGMETFFTSPVSCMYRMEAMDRVPGPEPFSLSFSNHVIAANLIHLDYKIRYVGNAEVIYDEKMTFRSALHEGFDYGVLQKKNIQAFGLYIIDDKSYDVIHRNLGSIYKDACKASLGALRSRGAFLKAVEARGCYLGLKYGNMLGKRYHRLPKWINRACCSQKDYFAG